jgi:hypothetical protein
MVNIPSSVTLFCFCGMKHNTHSVKWLKVLFSFILNLIVGQGLAMQIHWNVSKTKLKGI